MNTRAMVAAVLWVHCGGAAAELVRVGETFEYYAYIDLRTVGQSSRIQAMAVLRDYKQPRLLLGQLASSTRSITELDCHSRMLRTLSTSVHPGPLGLGEALSTQSQPGAWTPVAQASVNEDLLAYACKPGAAPRLKGRG